MTQTNALQLILNTLKTIQGSAMGLNSKCDCISNLKRVSEYIGDEMTFTQLIKELLDEKLPENWTEEEKKLAKKINYERGKK